MRSVRLKFITWAFWLAVFGATNVFAQGSGSLTPKESIRRAYKTLENQKSWVAEMIMVKDSSPGKSIITIRFLAPASSHLRWTYDGKLFTETITIGSDKYERLDGGWKKSREDEFGRLWDNLNKQIGISDEEYEKYMINVRYAGKESLGGVATDVYQYDYDLKALTRDIEEKLQTKSKRPEYFDEMKAKLWVNSAGLPVKFENIRRTEETKEKIGVIRKTITYTFNQAVEIEAPTLAPVKKKSK